jgi:hypothetical protein
MQHLQIWGKLYLPEYKRVKTDSICIYIMREKEQQQKHDKRQVQVTSSEQ